MNHREHGEHRVSFPKKTTNHASLSMDIQSNFLRVTNDSNLRALRKFIQSRECKSHE